MPGDRGLLGGDWRLLGVGLDDRSLRVFERHDLGDARTGVIADFAAQALGFDALADIA